MSGNNAINCKLLRYAVLLCMPSADVIVQKGGVQVQVFHELDLYTSMHGAPNW